MIQNCELKTKFSSSYLRNNRSTRQKSLRCFPVCSEKGHIAGGFCGQSLNLCFNLNGVKITNVKEDEETDPKLNTPGWFQNVLTDSEFEKIPFIQDDYYFVAEIRPLTAPRLCSRRIISKNELFDQIRAKNDKSALNKELLIGEIDFIEQDTGSTKISLSFNKGHNSWDYSWKSNRWSAPNSQHVVDIVVLKLISPQKLAIISYYTTPAFLIASSHKKSRPHSPGEKNRDEDDEEVEELGVLEASTLLQSLNGHGKRLRSDDPQNLYPEAKNIPDLPFPFQDILKKLPIEPYSNFQGVSSLISMTEKTDEPPSENILPTTSLPSPRALASLLVNNGYSFENKIQRKKLPTSEANKKLVESALFGPSVTTNNSSICSLSSKDSSLTNQEETNFKNTEDSQDLTDQTVTTKATSLSPSEELNTNILLPSKQSKFSINSNTNSKYPVSNSSGLHDIIVLPQRP